MKILHVITSLDMGGAEKLMVDLLPRLAGKNVEVELAIFDGKITPFYEELTSKGIKIHRFMKNGGSVYNPMNMIKLLRLIHKKKYDIVHTHNTAAQLFSPLAKKVLCSVVLCTTEHNTSNRRRGWRWYAPIDKWMYGQYDKIICISQKAEDNLRDYLKTEKNNICTINNGIDVAKYLFPIKDLALDKEILLIMVAGFRWEKDQDTIIRSLKFLPECYRLRLVGDGVRRNELLGLVNKEDVADRVEFYGLRNDIPQQLEAADIIIMSSNFEGLSLSSVEGMASGRPFIASDVDGLREVVKGAGVLFPHGDAKSLSDVIMRLTSDEKYYKDVSKKCQERARNFDIAKMASDYLKVYNNLVQKGNI